MTLKEFRQQTENLPDDFEIEMFVDASKETIPFVSNALYNVSVDIGHSGKVVKIFGNLFNKS